MMNKNNKNDVEVTFQKRLEQVLAELGFSQSELARMLGITPQCVNRWLKGISFPRPAVLKKLSELVNKPVSWFYFSHLKSNEYNQRVTDEDGSDNKEHLVNLIVTREEELLITLVRELPREECRNLIINICMKINGVE